VLEINAEKKRFVPRLLAKRHKASVIRFSSLLWGSPDPLALLVVLDNFSRHFRNAKTVGLNFNCIRCFCRGATSRVLSFQSRSAMSLSTAPNSRLPDLDVGSRAADVALALERRQSRKFSGQHQGKRGCRCHDLQKLGHLFTPTLLLLDKCLAHSSWAAMQKLGTLLPNYEWLG